MTVIVPRRRERGVLWGPAGCWTSKGSGLRRDFWFLHLEATVMIKRATAFHLHRQRAHGHALQLIGYERSYKVIKIRTQYVCIYMSVSVASGGPPENFEFGRCDFLYSGAFWGRLLPKHSLGFTAYVCSLNQHTFISYFPCWNAFLACLYSC